MKKKEINNTFKNSKDFSIRSHVTLTDKRSGIYQGNFLWVSESLRIESAIDTMQLAKNTFFWKKVLEIFYMYAHLNLTNLFKCHKMFLKIPEVNNFSSNQIFWAPDTLIERFY